MSEPIDHEQGERDIRIASWGIRLGFAVVLGVPAFGLARAVPASWVRAVDWFPLVVVLVLSAVGGVLAFALHRRLGGFPWWPR